jgi:GxxExxY protein
MQYEAITEKAIGCAYRVYNQMGFGFLESVYENCMAIELRNEGLTASCQQPITVRYRGEVVGDFVADIVVADVITI